MGYPFFEAAYSVLDVLGVAEEGPEAVVHVLLYVAVEKR